ncbi:MAG TPA: tetratricopeptide repeat protein [Pyrinomonadaceae bacterium]|nr:tetratricopeptide repeat protein [Pyrinomonadaceae bacterium]
MEAEIRTLMGSARTRERISNSHVNKLVRGCSFLIFLALAAVAGPGRAVAQNNHAIWGELRISGSTSDAAAPTGATIVLNKVGTGEIGRQTISSGGRYRFTNLSEGDYDLAVEAEGREITRVRLNILRGALAPFYGFRQDFEFAWLATSSTGKPKAISAADIYPRSAGNQSLFQKAQEAAGKKKYDDAVRFLKAILDNDKADFQVWSLLGTLYMVQEKTEDAEKAYLQALELRPALPQALLHLGKLRTSQKRFEEAIDPLTRALDTQPQSAEINLLLGESYLQTRKGSKAVPFLNEAARLGKPEAHLRLGWLYNAAGLREKAVAEYQEFLKKKPDYPDRKKLEQYISSP